MTNQDAVQIVMDDAARIIGQKYYRINTCTDQGVCEVCNDDKEEIERLMTLLNKGNKVVQSGLISGEQDDVLSTFLNLSDEVTEAAITVLGEEFSPY
jgi:hypothetical protein